MTASIIQAANAGSDDVGIRPRQQLRKSLLPFAGWAAAVLFMYELLAAADYPLHDADSVLYASISSSLEKRPWVEWLAPMWPAGAAKTGSFVEHLPFFFWPAAALGCLGAARGALLANLIYFLVGLYLLFRIARLLASAECAWFAVALYVVSPIGIQYLVRANQENAWAIGFLGALYCLLKPNPGAAAGFGFVLFAALAFAIKGVLALSLFPVLGLCWWVSSRRRAELIWFAAALSAIAAIALLYELSYRRLTGQSFFARYVETQLSYVYRDEGSGWFRKLINPLYYAGNILWFAFPSSLLAIIAFVRTRRAGKPATPSQVLSLLTTGGYFALAWPISRRAARYIFPVYGLICLPAAELILDCAPKLAPWLRRKEAHLPYVLMLILTFVVAARMAVDPRFYHFIQVF